MDNDFVTRQELANVHDDIRMISSNILKLTEKIGESVDVGHRLNQQSDRIAASESLINGLVEHATTTKVYWKVFSYVLGGVGTVSLAILGLLIKLLMFPS